MAGRPSASLRMKSAFYVCGSFWCFFWCRFSRGDGSGANDATAHHAQEGCTDTWGLNLTDEDWVFEQAAVIKVLKCCYHAAHGLQRR